MRRPSPDVKLVIAVRTALKEDKHLSLTRLSVTVRNRVVILEGDVPTEEQLKSAIRRVENVQGVAGVRTERVQITPLARTDDICRVPLQPERPRRTESLVPKRSPAINIGAADSPSFSRPESLPEIVAVWLAAPIPYIPLSGRTATVASIGRPRPLSEKRAPAEVQETTAEVVDRAQRGNASYQQLSVEVRGEAIWVRGSRDQTNTAMDFARALRDLGLRDVVVQCNE